MSYASEVIEGRRSWAVVEADRLDFARSLPAESIDLCFGSPPYEAARTYGIDFKLRGQQWVDWMTETFVELQRCTKGLVAMVLEGQTRGYRWSAVPALLMADLHRRGIHLRKPPIFKRVGIPGSGGPDWLRNDFEWIVCATKGGRLPWSDNTAMGHPPKWAPGGEMSNRQSNGARVNQWGHPISSGATVVDLDGSVRSEGRRPSHRETPFGPRPSEACGREGYKRTYFNGKGHPGNRKRLGRGMSNGLEETPKGGTMYSIDPENYDPPAIANPGNVIEYIPFIEELTIYGIRESKHPDEVLRELRDAIDTEGLFQWSARVDDRVRATAVLQSELQGDVATSAGRPKARRIATSRAKDCKENQTETELRTLRDDEATGNTPQGSGCDEQRSGKPRVPVSAVSPEGTQERELYRARMRSALSGQGLLQHALLSVEAARQSLCEARSSWSDDAGNIVNCVVGGGVMGDRIAHVNEAPYPEALAEFFIRSFCPPNGIVCDPFSGSGTTARVAIQTGRRFIGCDIRASQVELTKRRLASVQRDLIT